ncbi:hypothetical protein JZ751_016972 [Albula glossodonta]|uniref:Uncharacterized protein n=1 Tax=Albula glossodonta TaxID=121402 RepID=A0A8T2N1R8_9TELE|nr:hypothetical protein JZ751_016972 [Albula glossodonta]
MLSGSFRHLLSALLILPAPSACSPAPSGTFCLLSGSNTSSIGQSDPGVEVLFWNGRRVLVPGGVAVWISPSLHESILGELQRPLPLCCRGDLQGYLPCPGCALCPTLLALTPAVAPPPCPLREWWHLSSTPSYANELKDTALMERKELERKVDTQLQELRGSTGSLSSSSSSSSDDEETVTDTEPKPLATLTRKTSKSVQVMSPGVPSDCPTNRSALFLSVPVTIGQRVTIKDVLHQTDGGPPSASSAQLQLSVTGKRVPAAQM